MTSAHHPSLAELKRVARECAEADWDGYGAAPVDPGAVEVAEKAIRALPKGVSPPDVSADPDGEVSLTWFGADRSSISVSINADGRLSYAIGGGPGPGAFGTAAFEGQWPSEPLALVRRSSVGTRE